MMKREIHEIIKSQIKIIRKWWLNNLLMNIKEVRVKLLEVEAKLGVEENELSDFIFEISDEKR